MTEEVYLQIDFESKQRGDNLKVIEFFGVPAEQSADGDYRVSEKVEEFLEGFIAKELFAANRTLSKYSFESLQIWLYDTQKTRDSQGHTLPPKEAPTIQFCPPMADSELQYISILDIGLSDIQQALWKEGCEELFTPLFQRFVPPPDPPDILHEFLQMRLGVALANKLDLYLSMRQNMCFDALIIQAK